MKTTLTTTVATMSVAILLSLTIASCAGSRPNSTGGWHNMGVGPKDNRSMPDENMPGRR
ncbi:MAG: hypothetical protein WAW39_24905 [Prosthecobacter sp.]|jgi:hypothetical protein|uniref:hypothetical protein n=1 Tax=Prosthecobacter sp. TaxID=1965333 RepID=UPI003BAE2E88